MVLNNKIAKSDEIIHESDVFQRNAMSNRIFPFLPPITSNPPNPRILIVIHVVGIARKGAFEPRVLGLCVVEYHVKHQPDAARLCYANEGVHVLHRAETRVDGTVVRDIVTIVVLL